MPPVCPHVKDLCADVYVSGARSKCVTVNWAQLEHQHSFLSLHVFLDPLSCPLPTLHRPDPSINSYVDLQQPGSKAADELKGLIDCIEIDNMKAEGKLKHLNPPPGGSLHYMS